jgi:hypothetical protein
MKKDLESDPATLAMIAEVRAGLDASVPGYLKGAPSNENSASDATTKELDPRRLQELDTVFKSFDKDGNGMIDTDELRELTIALGAPMDAAACETNAEHCLSAPAHAAPRRAIHRAGTAHCCERNGRDDCSCPDDRRA